MYDRGESGGQNVSCNLERKKEVIVMISLDQVCLLACIAAASVGFIILAYICAVSPDVLNPGFW